MNWTTLSLHAAAKSSILSELARDAVESLQLGEEDLEIEVLSGSFWITLEGDSNDYAVANGQTVTFSGPGLLVIQGLSAVNVWSYRAISFTYS